MATTINRLNDILKCINLNTVSCRKMMGEYLLYAEGVLFGGIYDGRLLVKDTPAGREVFPDAPLQFAYAGAKPMIFIDDTAMKNGEEITRLIKVTCEALKNKKR